MFFVRCCLWCFIIFLFFGAYLEALRSYVVVFVSFESGAFFRSELCQPSRFLRVVSEGHPLRPLAHKANDNIPNKQKTFGGGQGFYPDDLKTKVILCFHLKRSKNIQNGLPRLGVF